jgi:hypothetical protein
LRGEVTEIPLAIGRGETVENAEAVGFMLRGFFKNVRRHVAFEREHVLPMIAISRRPRAISGKVWAVFRPELRQNKDLEWFAVSLNR